MKMIIVKCFGFAGALGVAVASLAQSNSPTAPGPRIVFAAPDYNFGKVDSGTAVKHDFVFTNTGNQTLEISGVRPSCGCTTAGNWDKTVASGQTGKIPVQFNSGGYGGEVHKQVFITCNDATKPNITLNLQGTVWKPISVVPAYALFNLKPEGQSNETRVVRIINNTDQPVTVSDPSCGNPAFQMEIQTVQPGKVFELRVTAIASRISGTLSAPITLKTSSPRMPTVSLAAFAMLQPLFLASPPQIMLPAGPLSNATQFAVMIQNNGNEPVVLSDPKVNASGADVQLSERQVGRQYNLTVSFPAGFKAQPNGSIQATVKTGLAKQPFITIPVFQPALPATPAATPAARGGSAAAKPSPAVAGAVALKK